MQPGALFVRTNQKAPLRGELSPWATEGWTLVPVEGTIDLPGGGGKAALTGEVIP